ncbi:YSIRK-type signal peptide-containing protein [Mammaliicoccus sciuri]
MGKIKKQRFSIRKFTMGIGSVLLGFTIFSMTNSDDVKANEKRRVTP